MNAIYIPLIITTLTIPGGFAAYGYQKMIDRKNALIAARRECYQKLLTSLQNFLSSGDSQAFLQFNLNRAEAFLLASDKVAMAIGNFIAANQHDISENSDLTASASIDAYCIMAREMRNDCFEKTNLSDEQLKLAVPVSHSRIEKQK